MHAHAVREKWELRCLHRGHRIDPCATSFAAPERRETRKFRRREGNVELQTVCTYNIKSI
uniref:Uncharacterized protein n=1 Tax=Oryza sativa subsp. japonica TaxID=39947 RepID=Q6K3C0_ORYSJ|nr:hypothetical protein [Oryza sativa Japonica Group]